ncbi:RICIN domain-containing protein [Streptomyces sp. NPDC049687]|uniref:RICIN domain-containing protein n=1 Tax=Streptomyces sp. NPDC049687 TaxID=3365596 RepID=UPI0037A367D4
MSPKQPFLGLRVQVAGARGASHPRSELDGGSLRHHPASEHGTGEQELYVQLRGEGVPPVPGLLGSAAQRGQMEELDMVNAERLDTGQAEGVKVSVKSHAPGRFARRVWTAVLAMAVSMGFVFLNAGSASALNYGDLIGRNFLRNWATGLCLDSNDLGNGTGDVYTRPCQQGNKYQTWEVFYVFHAYYDMVYIRNQQTGFYLNMRDDGSLVTRMYTSQAWEGAGTGWDKVSLRISGSCLDSNTSGSAYTLGCNDGGYQKWKLGY